MLSNFFDEGVHQTDLFTSWKRQPKNNMLMKTLDKN